MNTPFTTTVADTLYAPQGQTTSGNLTVSNPTFVSADGFTILQGFSVVVPVVNGAFSVDLIPYAAYNVSVNVTQGSYTQVWDVPHSDTPVTLADVVVG
jgi:hypothetical protein